MYVSPKWLQLRRFGELNFRDFKHFCNCINLNIKNELL